MTSKQLSDNIRNTSMIRPFREESSDPKREAQRNLIGRTHYVDDDTLRFHKSKVLAARVLFDGLLFAIVESYSADYEGTWRLVRPVVFDIFGNVIDRVELADGFKTRKQAEKRLDLVLDGFQPVTHTRDAIASHCRNLIREIEYLTNACKGE